MATIGSGLAEIYVMRKLHKEAMRKAMEEEKREKRSEDGGDGEKGKKSSGSGCFFWGLGKNHPTAKVSSSDYE
uniref:Uncharacterized protein n=1 Tax=Rhizophora mucronata TaxID=61149 RepID=A0A2P2Q6U6_RHIMU